jgi:NO-binding membrane sensor protein with MHYT domain
MAMGGGIWSMHFIGMLAFVMPISVTYDLGLTLLSLVVAIGVTGFGFFMIGTHRATALEFILSGIFMGVGIVSCITPVWRLCACQLISAMTLS